MDRSVVRRLGVGSLLCVCLAVCGPSVRLVAQSPAGPDLATLLAEDGRFTVLLELIGRVDLDARLRSPEPLTLVAPTDAAFAKLPPETLALLRDAARGGVLAELLAFHAINGRWTLADFGRVARVPSLQGQELGLRQIDVDRYAIDVGVLLESDRLASNGVLHVVDAVLQPAGLQILDEAELFGGGRHTYAVDVDHSAVVFRIVHMGVGAQWGWFSRFDGELVVDAEQPEACSIVLAVEVASIDTRQPKRDAYLLTEDFFDVVRHPVMTFRSEVVRAREDGDLDVEGELSLRGVTRPVTCVVRKLGEGRFGPRTYKVGYETEFRIRRSEFGMTFGIPGVAADEVRLVVALEGTRELE